MNKIISNWVRTLGAALATVYFLTNVALAYTPEKNLWTERRRHVEQNRAGTQDNLLLASLPAASSPTALFQTLPIASKATSALSSDLAKTLPAGFVEKHKGLFNALLTTHGTIRKVWLPAKNAGDRVVVHIQDVHQNEDAQRHIGGAVDALVQAHQTDLVALEGAFSPIDVKAFHDFEDREVIGLTADCLLRQNFITGPVHAFMTTKAALPPLVGVDDKTHYDANVEAYRQSAPKMNEMKKALAALKADLDLKKKQVFSPALLAFDAMVGAYKEEKASLADYVGALAPAMGVGQTGLLAEAFKMEKALNFDQVERDRKGLIDVLVKNINKAQTEQLIMESAGYRTGEVRTGDFYCYLQNLCRSVNVDLAQFPHMDAYIKYVMLSDRIDGEKLMDEMALLEKDRYATLSRTEEEKSLIGQSYKLHLTSRLMSFALTPVEWTEYQAMRSVEVPSINGLSSFESFYQQAHSRDEDMAKNLLTSMETDHANQAILVTGGYHTEGVSERLRLAGITVITFTPRIEKVDTENGSAYLSIFTQEKTPLEKLFAGEKLYVTQLVCPESSRALGAATAAARTVEVTGAVEKAQNIFQRLFSRGSYSVLARLRNGRGFVDLIPEKAIKAVQVSLRPDRDGNFSIQQKIITVGGFAVACYFLAPQVVSAISFLMGDMSIHAVVVPGRNFFALMASATMFLVTAIYMNFPNGSFRPASNVTPKRINQAASGFLKIPTLKVFTVGLLLLVAGSFAFGADNVISLTWDQQLFSIVSEPLNYLSFAVLAGLRIIRITGPAKEQEEGIKEEINKLLRGLNDLPPSENQVIIKLRSGGATIEFPLIALDRNELEEVLNKFRERNHQSQGPNSIQISVPPDSSFPPMSEREWLDICGLQGYRGNFRIDNNYRVYLAELINVDGGNSGGGKSDYSFPQGGATTLQARPKNVSDAGLPLYRKVQTVLAGLFALTNGYAFAGTNLIFSWDLFLFWGFVVSSPVLLGALSYNLIFLLMKRTALKKIQTGYKDIANDLGMAQTGIPASVSQTITNAPKGDVAVLTLLKKAESENSSRGTHEFAPSVALTETIKDLVRQKGRDGSDSNEKSQYAPSANPLEQATGQIRDYPHKSKAIIFAVPSENMSSGEFSGSASEAFYLAAHQALLEGGFFHFWVPKTDVNPDENSIRAALGRAGFEKITTKKTEFGLEFVAEKKKSPSIMKKLFVALAGILGIASVHPSTLPSTPNREIQYDDSPAIIHNENGSPFPSKKVVSRNRPLSESSPETDAATFAHAMGNPQSLLELVTPIPVKVTNFDGRKEVVHRVPKFAEDMAFWGFESEDKTYLERFTKALAEQMDQNPELQRNNQLMTILNTLLGGVTSGKPIVADISQMQILEATVNNRGELDNIVQLAKTIQSANEIIGNQGGKGIRIALSPTEGANRRQILSALSENEVDPSLYHVKSDPTDGNNYELDGYVAEFQTAMVHFGAQASSVNVQYLNAPNIKDLSADMVAKMQAGNDDLRKLLAMSLLAWLKMDRLFTIDVFNTMLQAAVVASKNA